MKTIKKISLILFIFCLAQMYTYAQEFGNYLSKNSFIPIQPIKPLSSASYEEKDIVYFIVPSDLWLEEYKIVPKNSIVKAQITMLKMPIVGINAAMRLKAISISFPNGNTYELKGVLTYKGEIQIGGNLTPPLSYNKTLHPRKGEYYNGVVAQYVPSGEYEFGQHITIMPHETLYVILSEDFSP